MGMIPTSTLWRSKARLGLGLFSPAFLILSAFAAALLGSPPAAASCDQTGSNVSCTGTTFNYDSGAQSGITVTVQSSATVIGTDPDFTAVKISQAAPFAPNTLVNNGTIDGFVTILSANPGDDTFINNGVLKITNPGALLQQHSMAGANYIQTAGGTLMARVDANGFNDGIFAWNAALQGRLIAVIQPGIYVTPITYDIVTTTTGVTGQFTSVTTSSPFFSATIVNNGISDSLTLNTIPFNAVPGLTRNQQAVANALTAAFSPNVTGDAATFYSNLFAASSVGVFDQLSGEGTSALQNASFNVGSLFNNAMQGQGLDGDLSGATVVTIPPAQYAATPKPRGQDAFASIKKAPDPSTVETGRWRIWTLGFGAYRSLDGNATVGSANQKLHNYGGAIGIDHQISPDLLLGFSAGGSESSISVASLSTTGQTTGGHFGVYGVKTWGPYYTSAAASYARLYNSTTRTISGIGPDEIATGKFASDQLSARFEFGWKQAFAYYTLTPFVAIEPAALWAHAYTESSTIIGGGPGILGLTFAARTTTSLPTFVGMQVDTRMVFSDGSVLRPYARASWVHEFEPNRQVNAAFITIPAAAFTVDGARAASDAARIDAGVKYAFDATRSLFTNVSGEWSNVGHSVSATAGFKLVR